MSKLNIVLDASMLDMFSLCEERFRLRYIENKVLPTKAKQLDRGSLVHTGQEAYYKALQQGFAMNPAVDAMCTAVMQSAASEESDLPMDEVDRVIRVLKEHAYYWQATDQSYEILAVETPFTYVLHEDDEVKIVMAGKIDLLVNDHPKYLNLVIDHKSYERDYPLKRLSHQFINYAYAVQSNILLVNRIGFQKTLKPVEKFKRIPLSYDELFFEQWKEDVRTIVDRYIHCVGTQQFAKNYTSCDKFYRECEYLRVCESSGKPAKLYKLANDYNTIDPWDVTQILSQPKKDEL